MLDKLRTDILQLRAIGGIVQDPNIVSDGDVNIQAGAGSLINALSNLDMNDNEILRTILQKLIYQGMSSRLLVSSDFMRQVGTSPTAEGVVTVAAGAGAGIISSATLDKTDHPGVWRMSTGSTAAGRVFVIGGSANGFHFGVGGVTRIGSWVRTGPTLSDAAQEYVLRAGSFNIALPNTITYGIGFEYQFDQNGGRWQGITEDAAESSLDTGITVAVDTWYFLEFEVNAAGTSVEFFIDKVSVGTLAVAANIPSGVVIDNFYNAHIMKLVGTTARTFSIDAYYVYQELTR